MVGTAMLPPVTVHPVPQVLLVICTSPGAVLRSGQVGQTVGAVVPLTTGPEQSVVVLRQRTYTVMADVVYVGAVVVQGPASLVAYSKTVPPPQPLPEIVPEEEGQTLSVMVSTKPQLLTGEAELRGFGAPAAKSAELLLVSVQPLLARKMAVVLL